MPQTAGSSDGSRGAALAAHGGPADLLWRWRPSWARCAPATGGGRQPGGRRRRLQPGASQRPPCPRPCFAASRAAQVHVRALSVTQCFQHCQFPLADRLGSFEKALEEPGHATWAAPAAHLCLVVAGVSQAGSWLGAGQGHALPGACASPEPRPHHPHRAFCAHLRQPPKDLPWLSHEQCAPGLFSPIRVSKPCQKPPTLCCSFPSSLPAPQALVDGRCWASGWGVQAGRINRRWGARGIAGRDEGEQQRHLALLQPWMSDERRLNTVLCNIYS